MLTQLIKIWGEERNARKANLDFKSFADAIIAEAETSPRKTRGWSKPDRDLTEKQIKRKERAERRLEELRRFQGMPDPDTKFPYIVYSYVASANFRAYLTGLRMESIHFMCLE